MAQHSSGSDDGDAALLRRLVVLAQGLVGDADGTRFLNMLLQAVVELTAAATASICVLDGDAPTILASTSPRVTELELTQLEDPAGGPCRECLRLAEAVSMPNLATDPRWPAFTRMARSFGVSEVHVLPLTTRSPTCSATSPPRPCSSARAAPGSGRRSRTSASR
jgi:hypothetical protein